MAIYICKKTHTKIEIFHNKVCSKDFKGMVSVLLLETPQKNCVIYCLNYADSSGDIAGFLTE